MIEPGIYRMQWRKLSLAECRRLSGPKTFWLALVSKLLNKQGSHVWLPSSQITPPCEAGDLSDEAQSLLAAYRAEMDSLGYRRGGFARVTRLLDPATRESAEYVALHDDGHRIMAALYVHLVIEGPPEPLVIRHVGLAGQFHLREGSATTSVLDHREYLDAAPPSRTLMTRAPGVAGINRTLEEELQAATAPLQFFSTLDEMLSVRHRVADEASAALIARGAYRKVSADEEQRALERAGLAP